jgi:phosphoglucomutase
MAARVADMLLLHLAPSCHRAVHGMQPPQACHSPYTCQTLYDSLAGTYTDNLTSQLCKYTTTLLQSNSLAAAAQAAATSPLAGSLSCIGGMNCTASTACYVSTPSQLPTAACVCSEAW